MTQINLVKIVQNVQLYRKVALLKYDQFKLKPTQSSDIL